MMCGTNREDTRRRAEVRGECDEGALASRAGSIVFGADVRWNISFCVVPAVGLGGGGGEHHPWRAAVPSGFNDWRLDREQNGSEQIAEVDCDGIGSGGGVLFPDRENAAFNA